MRVTWDATIAVTIARAKELGHTLTAFGLKEGRPFRIDNSSGEMHSLWLSFFD